MKTQHTPGTWTVEGEYVESLDLDKPLSICSLADCGKQTKANANLIAAAPDLLEALKLLLEHEGSVTYNGLGQECDTDELETARDKARAAIAKAEGGAQ